MNIQKNKRTNITRTSHAVSALSNDDGMDMVIHSRGRTHNLFNESSMIRANARRSKTSSSSRSVELRNAFLEGRRIPSTLESSHSLLFNHYAPSVDNITNHYEMNNEHFEKEEERLNGTHGDLELDLLIQEMNKDCSRDGLSTNYNLSNVFEE